MQIFSPHSLPSHYTSTTYSGTDMESIIEIPGSLSDTGSLDTVPPRAAQNRRTTDSVDRRLREMR